MERYYKVGDTWCYQDTEMGSPAADPTVSTVTLTVLLGSEYDLFTVDEVAEALRLSANTVRKLVSDGELEAIKIGSNYRITRNALEQLKPNQPKGTVRKESIAD